MSLLTTHCQDETTLWKETELLHRWETVMNQTHSLVEMHANTISLSILGMIARNWLLISLLTLVVITWDKQPEYEMDGHSGIWHSETLNGDDSDSHGKRKSGR